VRATAKPDFNGARQNGVGLYTFTQSNGERVTAEGAYLDTVRARPNLTVMADTKVTRLLLDGRRVTGVAYRRGGEEGAHAAREVILSAGCFVSPHLLMLSGIGNARDLARHGIAPVHDLPGVGENLQDHLDITLEYRARSTAPYGVSWRALPRNVLHVLDWFARGRGLFASTTGEGGGFVSTDPASDRPDIQLFFCTGRANTQEASGFAAARISHARLPAPSRQHRPPDAAECGSGRQTLYPLQLFPRRQQHGAAAPGAFAWCGGSSPRTRSRRISTPSWIPAQT